MRILLCNDRYRIVLDGKPRHEKCRRHHTEVWVNKLDCKYDYLQMSNRKTHVQPTCWLKHYQLTEALWAALGMVKDGTILPATITNQIEGVYFRQAWRTQQVKNAALKMEYALIREIFMDSKPSWCVKHTPILADLLEETGCDCQPLLDYLRKDQIPASEWLAIRVLIHDGWKDWNIGVSQIAWAHIRSSVLTEPRLVLLQQPAYQ